MELEANLLCACGLPPSPISCREVPVPPAGTSHTHNEGWMEDSISSPVGSFQGCAVFQKARECQDSPGVWPTSLESGCLRAGLREAGV